MVVVALQRIQIAACIVCNVLLLILAGNYQMCTSNDLKEYIWLLNVGVMTYDTAVLPSLVHRPASQLPSTGYPTAMSTLVNHSSNDYISFDYFSTRILNGGKFCECGLIAASLWILWLMHSVCPMRTGPADEKAEASSLESILKLRGTPNHQYLTLS